MSGAHQMLLGGGGDTEVVSVGTWAFAYSTFYGFADATYSYYSGGSITDGRLAPAGGAKIIKLLSSFYVSGGVTLEVNGTVPNAGWQTMTVKVGGQTTVLRRSEATFSAGTTSSWYWEMPTNNTFGTTAGAIATCVFA